MKNQRTKFVILGLLTIKPLSGYDIKKIINKSLHHIWSESNGQLYPALKQLVKEDFIVLKQKQKNERKERLLYSITEKGRVELKKWLAETTKRKNFHRDEELLKFFFGKHSSSKENIELLKKREQRIKEKLSQYVLLQKKLETLIHSLHYHYWNLCLKNRLCLAKAELQWCQESIKTLRKQDPS